MTSDTPSRPDDPRRAACDLEAEAVRRRIAARMFGAAEEPVFLGRFRVLRLLGEGGMGRVYAAEDDQLGRVVALKVIRPGRLAQGSDERARMLREARALARLSHPNVVQVHEVGEHGDEVFITMEYIPGQTLDRWLEARPRGLAEVLAVFVAAGRGLAAAHDAGIAHRDFKPTNVVVGDDGRVRILDFGLARDAGDVSARSTAAGGATTSGSSGGGGTPGYMSPEHLAGRADARSDQFSFCVALCEAALGGRPAALAARSGPRLPARGPRWLRRVLARGVALHADRRHASMHSLLAALERGQRRARRVAAALLVCVAVIAAAIAGALASASQPPCRQVGAPLAEIWSPARMDMVERSLIADGMEPAGARGIVAAIDDYARRWLERRVDACEATRVRGERSEAALDRGMACLDRGARGLAALLDAFTTPAPARRAAAPELLAALPDPAACHDLEALADGPPPTPGLLALHERLDRARLSYLARRDAAAVAPIEAVLADSRAAGAAEVEVEALLLLGTLQGRVLRDGEQALATLHQALALAAGRPALLRTIWIELARVEADEREAPAQARRWLASVRAASDGWPEEPALLAELRTAEGFVAAAEGDLPAAVERHREALALRRPDDPERDLTRMLLANALADAGRPREALELLTAALAERRAALGPEHPLTAALEHSLGMVHVDLGNMSEATGLFRHARKVILSTFGAGGPRLASLDLELAHALAGAGEREAAIRHAEAALALIEATRPPTYSERLRALLLLAELYRQGGRDAEALAVNRRLLDLADAHGLDLDVPGLLVNIGDYLCLMGRCGASLPYFARLAADLSQRPGDDGALLGYALQGLGHAHLAGGEPARALPMLEEARRVLAAHPQASPHIAAQTARLLARCLRALAAQPRRARALDAEAAALERDLAG